METIICSKNHLPLSQYLQPPPPHSYISRILLPQTRMAQTLSGSRALSGSITHPVTCTVWDPGPLNPWSPFIDNHSSLKGLFLTDALPPVSLGFFYYSSGRVYPSLFSLKDWNSNPFLQAVLVDSVSPGLASPLCIPFSSHPANTLLDYTRFSNPSLPQTFSGGL